MKGSLFVFLTNHRVLALLLEEQRNNETTKQGRNKVTAKQGDRLLV
jgi:hypothetical protein